MKTLLTLALGLVAAAPVHAVSIVSLHGGMAPPTASSTSDTVLLTAGLIALTAVVAYRAFRRKVGVQR